VTRGEFGDGARDFEEGGFILRGEIGFEFGAAVEVIFHGGLAAAGDDDDLGCSRQLRLLRLRTG